MSKLIFQNEGEGRPSKLLSLRSGEVFRFIHNPVLCMIGTYRSGMLKYMNLGSGEISDISSKDCDIVRISGVLKFAEEV